MDIKIINHYSAPEENLPLTINNLIKRGVDVIASFIGLLLLAPFFILIGVGIKLDSPGPVFYWGPRSARNGGVFYILKFRTMFEQSTSYQGAKVTAKDDQRITPLGRWLRDTKINELPQLWNVLVGEMSLVGPRPEDPEIVATWREDLRKEILSVRPGITSPASVIYRHEEDLLDSKDVMNTYIKSILPSKMRLDQLYIRNCSLLVDIDILVWTLLVLLPRMGSVPLAEDSLFWGPISRLFRHYLNWFVVDMVIIITTFSMMGFFWGILDTKNAPEEIIISLLFASVFSTTGAMLGVNRISWSKALIRDALDLIPPLVMATLMTIIVNGLFHVYPIGFILATTILTYNGLIAIRYRSHWLPILMSRIRWIGNTAVPITEKILIVDSGSDGQFVAKVLNLKRSVSPYKVIGFIDEDYHNKGRRIQGLKVLGGAKDIPGLVQHHDVGIIILALQDIDPAERQKILMHCHQTQARVFQSSEILMSLGSIPSATESDKTIIEQAPENVEGNLAPDLPVLPVEGVYDREQIELSAKQVFNRSVQNDLPLTAIAFEMDYPQSVEDVHESAVDDQHLSRIVSLCKKSLRAFDLLWKYDQRRLVLLIPDTRLTSAENILNRLLASIVDSLIDQNQGNLRVKFHLGMAERNRETTNLTSLISCAIADLMAAKQSERSSKFEKQMIVSQNNSLGQGLTI